MPSWSTSRSRLGIRPRPADVPAGRRGGAARRRRRGRQDPAADRAARPRRRRRLAGARRPLPRLRRQRAALPPVLRDPRPARRRAARPRRRGRRPPTPRCAAPAARPADAGRGRRTPESVAALDRADLFEAVHALARGRRRARPAAARRRGPALGRPVDPRPAELPVHPPLRRPGRARRVLPLRRPAPPPPAAPPGRRVVPPAAASSGSSSTPLGAADVRALVAELARPTRSPTTPRSRDIVDRAEGNAFFVEELVGAASGARAAGSPTTSPTCCWSGSTGSTTTRAPGRRAPPASPAAGSPTTLLARRRPGSTRAPSTRACARRSR